MKEFKNYGRNTFQKSLMDKKVYHIINISFGSIILCIVFYSLLFPSNNHPIPALLTQLTGIIPPSKGLSSSFSELVRGNINAAELLNPYGLRIFSFFLIQLFTRVLISITIEAEWLKLAKVTLFDSLFSIALFVICFSPLIVYTIQLFSQLL